MKKMAKFITASWTNESSEILTVTAFGSEDSYMCVIKEI